MEGISSSSQSPSSKKTGQTKESVFPHPRLGHVPAARTPPNQRGDLQYRAHTVDIAVAALKGEKVIVWVNDKAQRDIRAR